ncbi:MAG: hypothetical protein CFE36_00680 [Sphingomonadaceae bacterium PASS1]|nr:MAG: hypothetical protein CFE36_00680 [Sphingomonadaceae bacterium PASS1]
MIAFDLNCGNGHRFEGWFASSEDYSKQQSSGLLACPVCNDMTVQKALSVPHVPKKGNQRSVPVSIADIASPTVAAAPGNTDALPLAVVAFVQKLAVAQTEMLKQSQWVGGQFAETARAIHYGEEADRIIHGETSADEAKALMEEGVQVAPLLFPVVPPSAKN